MIAYNFIWVIAGCALIGAGASLVGTFAFLRKKSLVGDAVAHALLPGVVLAFMLFGQKSLWVLFPGALVAGWLSLLSIEAITTYSRIKSDTAIAIVLSVFFAIGIVLLTHIQQGQYGNQSGLDAFLFGKAAAMLPRDIYLFFAVDAIIIFLVLLFYPYFKLYSFDPEYASSVGLPVNWLSFLLSTLTVLAVATGIQAVGVVLMAALIITPAAAARFLAGRLSHMLGWALFFGMTGAVGGVLISYAAPSMPTGPWIVVLLSIMAILTFIFAPGKGLYNRYLIRSGHQKKITDENIVKALYHLADREGKKQVSITELTASRRFEGSKLETALKRLIKNNLIQKNEKSIELTDKGFDEGARVVRLHRLWELYLNVRMNIAEDHVHHDAEAIEHIITPKLEAELIKELNYPQTDPHASEIPGINKNRSHD